MLWRKHQVEPLVEAMGHWLRNELNNLSLACHLVEKQVRVMSGAEVYLTFPRGLIISFTEHVGVHFGLAQVVDATRPFLRPRGLIDIGRFIGNHGSSVVVVNGCSNACNRGIREDALSLCHCLRGSGCIQHEVGRHGYQACLPGGRRPAHQHRNVGRLCVFSFLVTNTSAMVL